MALIPLPGVQWTVVNDSNYARFSLSSCQTNVLPTSAHNTDDNQHTSSAAPSNTTVSSNHTQIQYGSGYTSGQMIALNPNLVNNYSASLSTPTSPQGDSNIVQSVYSQGPTPNQSPVQITGNAQNSLCTTSTTTVKIPWYGNKKKNIFSKKIHRKQFHQISVLMNI